MALPNIGNPDGYQKKGVAGEAKRMVVKRKGLAKLAQRGGDQREEWVRNFEWKLVKHKDRVAYNLLNVKINI